LVEQTKIMKKIIILLLSLFPLLANAQLHLKGNVQNNSAPVIWANVVLLHEDGKLVVGSLTKEDGSFEVNIQPGVYKIKISYLGFSEWQKKLVLEKDTDLGRIILQEDSGNLKEVTVTAKKKLVEYKADRLIFDVENNIAASDGNAITAIGAAPGVIVKNNTISMLGKGSSRVMIDGRMIELSGEDLITLLKSIAAKDIKNIEVITNPPAKYEAGGNGGVININLKKGALNSWKNSTTLSYDQNAYHSFSLRETFLYQKNKVKLAISAGGKSGDTQIKQDLNTYYPSGPWELKYEGKQKEDNTSGHLAFDYDLSDRTNIGIQYMGNFNSPGSNDLTKINIYTNRTLDSLLINTGIRKLNGNSHSYNAHLVSVLDTLHRKVSFDIDYFTYSSTINNRFTADIFLPDMEFLNTNQSAQNVSNRNIDNRSLKIDMEHPLKFANLSYGAKFSFIDSNGDIKYYNIIAPSPVLDPGRSNSFAYKESNQAAYVSGSKEISSKLSLQIGLRVEYTQTDGYSETLNQTNKNSYIKVFPTVYLSYKRNETHNFLINYGRRINRPDFGLLNPFRSYINSNSYAEGNPFLQPSFSDNFDFTHVYKGKLRTNIYLNITNNGFGPVFSSNPETNTLILTRQNYYKEYAYGAGEIYSFNITKWWQSQNTLYVLGSKTGFINGLDAVAKNSIQLYLSTNNTFSLSQSTRLQTDYFYSSPVKRGLYEIGYQSGLNLSLRQGFLQDKLQLSVLVNDVFNQAYLKNYTSVVNGIRQVYNENNSSRYFRLSLTFNFGNNKINVRQRDFGNDEERKRSN